ncbi:MAG TPA: CHAD domain-containing protein [Phycisphaerae bacterium]|nr:CHAD domain-containing protein [Phycisphaerae bacterium]
MNEGEERTTAGLLAAYVQKQLKRFEKNLAAAQTAGEVNAVHDVRVATRRLAEPLGLMARDLGRKQVQHERQLLRKARRALRKVRDLDVLQKSLMENPAGGGLEPTDLAQVEGILTQRREKALSSARRQWARLDSDKLTRRVGKLAEGYRDLTREGLDEELARRVRELFLRRAERLVARDPRRPETVDLHQTRICVKRLRYAAELMRDTQVHTDQGLIDSLAKIQERLGHWNDDLVAARLIARIAYKMSSLVEQPAWSARLLTYSAERARSAEAGRLAILNEWPQVDFALQRSVAPSESGVTYASAAIETPV